MNPTTHSAKHESRGNIRRLLSIGLGRIAAGGLMLFMSGSLAGAAPMVAPERLATTPPLSPGVMIRLARAPWIQGGRSESSRIVYVFVDAECTYCHQLWLAVSQAHPQVQIRYLMAAVIQPSSLGKAATILQARDPAQALVEHERAFAHGGVLEAKRILPGTREGIEANNTLMDALNIDATPGIVYTDGSGAARVHVGMPDSELLTQIFDGREKTSTQK